MGILSHLRNIISPQTGPHYQKTLSEFNKSLSIIVDKDQLCATVNAYIRKLIGIEQVYIFLLNPDTNHFEAEGKSQPTHPISLSPEDNLVFWLNVNDTFLHLAQRKEVFEFLSHKEQDFLLANKIQLSYPLRVMNQTKGVIFLTSKKDRLPFEENELKLLSLILNQASFALENASLYQQQKERLKKMYRTDRLAIMGELAAGAAHEIRNPLTSIRSVIQFLERDIQDPEKKMLAQGLIEEVDRINEIIRGLLSFSRHTAPEFEEVDLEKLIQDSILLIRNTALKKGVHINLSFEAHNKRLHADPGQLKQVFLNVLLNAIQATEGNGQTDIRVTEILQEGIRVGAPMPTFVISIKDSGKGIPEAHLDQIFDPFFTTKQDGTGLGLSISYGIIQKHGGDIEFESQKGKGTKVTIQLPTQQN